MKKQVFRGSLYNLNLSFDTYPLSPLPQKVLIFHQRIPFHFESLSSSVCLLPSPFYISQYPL